MATGLVFGAAMGLDLYLTLLLTSLAPLAGWELPSGLEGLATPLVTVLSGALWLAESTAERAPAVAAYWHLFQSVARPVAAALMTYLLVEAVGGPSSAQVVAPLAAAAVATAVHTAKLGWFMLSWWSSYHVARTLLVSMGEDAITLGLTFLAVRAPLGAGAAVAAVLLFLVLSGRVLLRAGAYSHYLAWSRSWDSLRPFRWHSEDELSADLAGEVAAIARPLGHRLRVTRAGGFRVPGAGLFRPGWLVVGPADPRWVCRTLRGPHMIVLDPGGTQESRVESLYVQVGVEPGSKASLIFPKGGPNLGAVTSGIAAAGPRSRPEDVAPGAGGGPPPTPGTQN